jgi:hypothetical protein
MIDQEKKIVSLEEYRRARREEDDPIPPSCPHAARCLPPPFLTLAVAAGGRPSSMRSEPVRSNGAGTLRLLNYCLRKQIVKFAITAERRYPWPEAARRSSPSRSRAVWRRGQ